MVKKIIASECNESGNISIAIPCEALDEQIDLIDADKKTAGVYCSTEDGHSDLLP